MQDGAAVEATATHFAVVITSLEQCHLSVEARSTARPKPRWRAPVLPTHESLHVPVGTSEDALAVMILYGVHRNSFDKTIANTSQVCPIVAFEDFALATISHELEVEIVLCEEKHQSTDRC